MSAKKQIQAELKKKQAELKKAQKAYEDAENLTFDLEEEIDLLEGKLEYADDIVPPAGKFIAYKKAFADTDDDLDGESVIITLEVPAKAKRITPRQDGNCEDGGEFKSRVCHAKVKSIVHKYSKKKFKKARSSHDDRFIYTVGKIVRPEHKFNETQEVCASGIHCFMDIEKAEDY